MIDLFVKRGYDEGEAAQLIMRRMLSAGIPPPKQGGDSRGWKRLLAWRIDLSHGIGSPEAKDEYRDFTRDIEAIPADERLSACSTSSSGTADESRADRARFIPPF